jgi:hypothetical protein
MYLNNSLRFAMALRSSKNDRASNSMLAQLAVIRQCKSCLFHRRLWHKKLYNYLSNKVVGPEFRIRITSL